MRVWTWFAPTAELIRPQMNTDEHRCRQKFLSVFICVHLWLVPLCLAAPRWNIQYLYDRADSNFAIEDLDCPTTRHCVAAGLIDDKRGHEQGTVVVSSDGGLHWSQYQVKERPLALFFLNDSLGWMVTDRGLWSTAEGGRSWIKLESRKGILQSWFLDANHGYIAGLKGLVQETADGGKTWTQLQAGGQAPDATLNYDIISFHGMHGVILGVADESAPVRFDPSPDLPAEGKITVLETLDGGKTWKSGTFPINGELAQLRLSESLLVTLMLYSDPKYPVASAVYETPLGHTDGRMIFAEHDRAATDIALLDDGGAVLVTIQPPGNSTQVPIPGKVKIFKSGNRKVWEEMDVDYRAVAQRAIIAAPDAQHMWVATDTGAILALVE
jgi:Photosynthesis system II assembly factor YCF48